jgi:hypothetical protein
MDINLDNGDTLGLADVNFHGNQYNWVTVLKTPQVRTPSHSVLAGRNSSTAPGV